MGGTIISLFAIYSKVLNRGIVPNKRTGGNLFQIWLAGLFLEFEIWKLKWRLLEAKHHTATAHFGTLTQCLVHPTVPKCAVAVWCLASDSLHGGRKKIMPMLKRQGF